jgi:hypothetical protein
MKCLSTILGLNVGDPVPNLGILELSGQPAIRNVARRNRLRWFGHVNRTEYDNNQVSLMKKVMFSYFLSSKRPGNVGIRKRLENKILENVENFRVKSWSRDTTDRDEWRQLINQHGQVTLVHSNIKKCRDGM